MIRPFYRSRLFWLGVPGLVFLLWGWLAIPLTTTTVTWKGRDRYVVLGHSSRIAFCYFAQLGKVPAGWKQGISVTSGTLFPESDTTVFPRAIKVDMGERGGFNVFVAYWFLIVIYLPLWLGIIAIWQHRKARLQKLHAAPEP